MNPAWEDDIVRAFETARAKGPVNCDIRMFFKPAGGTIVFREEDKYGDCHGVSVFVSGFLTPLCMLCSRLEWLDAVSVLTKKAVPKGRMLEEDAVTIFSDIGAGPRSCSEIPLPLSPLLHVGFSLKLGGDYAKEHIAAILRRTLRLLHHARTKASSVAIKPLQATS
jgi:hypothetical protein